MDAFAVTVDVVTGHWLLPARCGYAEHRTAFSYILWALRWQTELSRNPLVSLFYILLPVVSFSPFPPVIRLIEGKEPEAESTKGVQPTPQYGNTRSMQAASGNKTTGFAVEARGCRRKGGQEKAGDGGTKERSEAHLEQWSACIVYI
jgi:hypothetical protein